MNKQLQKHKGKAIEAAEMPPVEPLSAAQPRPAQTKQTHSCHCCWWHLWTPYDQQLRQSGRLTSWEWSQRYALWSQVQLLAALLLLPCWTAQPGLQELGWRWRSWLCSLGNQSMAASVWLRRVPNWHRPKPERRAESVSFCCRCSPSGYVLTKKHEHKTRLKVLHIQTQRHVGHVRHVCLSFMA